MSDKEDTFERRSVLKAAGTGAVAASGLPLAAASKKDSSLTEPVDRNVLEGRDKWRAIILARRNLGRSGINSRLARAGYSVTIRGAKAVEAELPGESGMSTYAFLPLKQNGEYVESGFVSEDTTDVATYVWTNNPDKDDFVLRTGDVSAVLDNNDVSVQANAAENGSAVEVITANEHSVTTYDTSADTNAVTKTANPAAAGHAHPPVEATSDVDTAGFCPSTVAGVVTAIGTCGGGCALCSTAAVGDWPAIFACIACAGCSCGLGCCLGKAGGSDVCTAATAMAVGGIFLSPAVAAGASCVASGCTDYSVCG
jgi:hypothetical protein